jgi:hypothetical protein
LATEVHSLEIVVGRGVLCVYVAEVARVQDDDVAEPEPQTFRGRRALDVVVEDEAGDLVRCRSSASGSNTLAAASVPSLLVKKN